MFDTCHFANVIFGIVVFPEDPVDIITLEIKLYIIFETSSAVLLTSSGMLFLIFSWIATKMNRLKEETIISIRLETIKSI